MASGKFDLPYATPVLNASGQPVSGASLTFFNTGTANLASIYADAALTTPVANPQTGIYGSNAAGRFTSQATLFWADASLAYDIVLGFPDGSDLTFDQVYVLGAATNVSGYAPINSPTFTGAPQAPTPASNDSSAKLATTAYVQAQGYAPTNSPTLTGTPAAPTAAPGANTTQIATTAFVEAAIKLAQSLGANGYYTLPGGLILQWGHAAGSFGAGPVAAITFPIAFPTSCFLAKATIDNTGHATSTSTGIVVYVAPSTTGVQFEMVGYQSGSIQPVTGYYWFALGN